MPSALWRATVTALVAVVSVATAVIMLPVVLRVVGRRVARVWAAASEREVGWYLSWMLAFRHKALEAGHAAREVGRVALPKEDAQRS
jgi:hypothetical protein